MTTKLKFVDTEWDRRLDALIKRVSPNNPATDHPDPWSWVFEYWHFNFANRTLKRKATYSVIEEELLQAELPGVWEWAAQQLRAIEHNVQCAIRALEQLNVPAERLEVPRAWGFFLERVGKLCGLSYSWHSYPAVKIYSPDQYGRFLRLEVPACESKEEEHDDDNEESAKA